MFRFISVT